MNKRERSIVYVNFSPYENAGNILDYLRETFDLVVMFSFRFHNISHDQNADTITVFKRGNAVFRHHLFTAPVVSTMTFFLLPLRSFIILTQICFYCIKLRYKYGIFDIYFTVNGYTAWVGNLLRNLGIIRKTVFWVWDYYPPSHKDFIVRTMRSLYWLFDGPAGKNSDKTVFLNKRLERLRKDAGLLPRRKIYQVVPIGTNPIRSIPKRSRSALKLVFFGVLKVSQGLDIVLQNGQEISDTFPNAELHVIGDGPDKAYFQSLAGRSPLNTKFYGYLPDEQNIKEVIAACDIGLAPYMPDVSNVSYYTDPSKIKMYLSAGIPTVMTDFLSFSAEIRASRAGIVLKNAAGKELIAAIHAITRRMPAYKKAALALAKRYEYRTIYAKLLTDV